MLSILYNKQRSATAFPFMLWEAFGQTLKSHSDREAPASREGLGRILVNGRRFFDYFGAILSREDVLKPMEVTDTLGKFDLKVNVTGGGITGQSQVIGS